MKFLKQATFTRFVLAKLSKFAQIADLFRFLFTEDLLKIKKDQATFFMEFFHKNFSLVILHKLVKFHYQIVFTSQVIH